MSARVLQRPTSGGSPGSDAIDVVVVDPGARIGDETWSALSDRGVVVTRLRERSRALDDIRRLRPSAVIVVSGGDDDRQLMAAVADHAVLAVVDDDAGAAAVTQALRAGARGVVFRSTVRTGAMVDALRAVVAGRAHLSPDVAAIVAEEIRAQRLDVVGERLRHLTRREHDVMRLVADGLTNPQIAAALSVSRKTVKNHLTNVYAKLGVSDRSSAVDVWRGEGPQPT